MKAAAFPGEESWRVPAPELEPDARASVTLAIDYLGLKQSMLIGQRRRTMRQARRAINSYKAVAKIPKGERSANDRANLKEAEPEVLDVVSVW